jgi:hypothetical protein
VYKTQGYLPACPHQCNIEPFILSPVPFLISPMLLERSDTIHDLSDPNIVLGPRKHHLTERVLENGDPLACKKRRKVHVSTADVLADKEKLTVDTTPQLSQSTCPTNGTESGDDQPDQASDGVWAIVVDDSDDEGSDEGEVTDEDDNAELGM